MDHAYRAADLWRSVRRGSPVCGSDPGRSGAVLSSARPLGSFRLGPVSVYRRARLLIHPLHRIPVPARQLVRHRGLGSAVPGTHVAPWPCRALAASRGDGAVTPVHLPGAAGALGPHWPGMDLLTAVLLGLRGVLPGRDLLLRPLPDLAAHVPFGRLPHPVHPASVPVRRTGRSTVRLGLCHRPVDRRRPSRVGCVRRPRPGLLACHGAHGRCCPRRLRCPAGGVAVVGRGLERVSSRPRPSTATACTIPSRRS